MSTEFTVKLSKIIEELSLETLYTPCKTDEIYISSKDVSRLGIELTGFLDYFDNSRILVVGNTEHAYLEKFSNDERFEIIDKIFSLNPPVIIIARHLPVFNEIMKSAEKNGVAVLGSEYSTSNLVSALVTLLNKELAPRITRHGVLVEVYGEGVLIVGDSGVGKSEAAVELIKRGHRLIADDAVEIRKTSQNTLVGCSPENIRHFIEVRGIGIVNVRRLFGMGAIKQQERINIVMNLELWDSTKSYERIGLESQYVEILGVRIPILTIPVKPGRNLAVIIEIAAMNNRQKKMGYNAAFELFTKLNEGSGAELSMEDVITEKDSNIQI